MMSVNEVERPGDDRELYELLRGLAGHLMARQRAGHTLQPTALIHEAWIKVGRNPERWHDERHFLRAAARAMRQILVDHARSRAAGKRKLNGNRVPLHEVICDPQAHPAEVLSLNEAVDDLSCLDAELGRIVELRYFAGMTLVETARVLNISRQRVERRWRAARAWLAERLSPAE